MGHDHLPRVTSLLRDAGLTSVDFVPETALARGSAVHLAAQYLDEDGDVDRESIDPEVAPALSSYEKFLAEMKPEILAIEERVVNETLGYRGTLDRRMRINGAEWVVDLKTGLTCHATHALQTQFYALAFDRPLRRACLHLGPDRYVFTEHADRDDRRVCLAILAVVSWKSRKCA